MSGPPNQRIDEQIEALLGGELDSLEGEHDAVGLWALLKIDVAARTRYDAMVHGLREFAGKTGVRSFHDGEADALWPVLMGHVAADARHRSGLSKQALTHLAIPQMMASITQALSDFSKRTTNNSDEVVVDMPIESKETKEVNFSLTRVGGEVGFRLYRNDELDVRCNLEGNELRSNVAPADWEGVTAALTELSRVTSALLGEEVLVNGRISIHDGRAEVRLNPFDVIRASKD